jgi:murein DD-endopeptidase MepM/ murein hydrolase activator NlpD
MAVLAVGAGPALAAPCWLPPVGAPITDPFRAPACPYCAGNRGLEYGTADGVPVRAVAAGTVTFAGSIGDDSYVVVRHADGRRTTYGNLRDLRFGRNDVVAARAVLGLTRGPLHFGLRVGDEYVDPAPFLGALRWRPRLVPVDGRAGNPAPPPRLACPAPPASAGAIRRAVHRVFAVHQVRNSGSPR